MEYKYKKLTPFKMQCLTNFPFIDEDFDALSNYGLLCKIVEYINEVAKNNNILIENIESLNNWFKNLDVQDEINNKLDEMAESGQLTDIIAQYLGLAGLLVFNTVDDMKNAINLVNGSVCKTLGFYNINDGGSSLYKIKTYNNQEIDNMINISLNNNLIAELINKDEVIVNQLGASTENLNNAEYINKAIEKFDIVKFLPGIYKTSIININKNVKLIGHNTTLEHVTNDDLNNTCIIKSTSDIDLKIDDIIFDGKKHNTFGLFLQYLNNIIINNITVKNIGEVGYSQGNTTSIDGIILSKCKNCLITNSSFVDIERDGILGYPCEILKVINCTFNNCGRFPSANTQSDGYIGGSEITGPIDTIYQNNIVNNCGCGGFDVETGSTLTPVHFSILNNIIKNCGNDDWGYSWGITAGSNSYGDIIGNNIENFAMNSENDRGSGIIIGSTKGDVIVTNNILKNIHYHGIYAENSGNDVVINNNSIDNTLKDGIYLSSQAYASVIGNIIKNANNNGIRLNLSSSCHIIGNTIKNASNNNSNIYSSIKTLLSFGLNISNNNISGNNHKYGFELDNHDYVKQINFVSNIIYDAQTRWFNFAGTNSTSGDIKNGVCEFISTSIYGVNDGTWNVGDKLLIFDYTTQRYLGRVCIEAGTPGVWKYYSPIAE